MQPAAAIKCNKQVICILSHGKLTDNAKISIKLWTHLESSVGDQTEDDVSTGRSDACLRYLESDRIG